MLQKIRDGRRGIWGILTLGAIVVVMAFFGIGSFFAPDTNPAIAAVNGTEISQTEYQNRYQRYLSGERQRLGEQFDPQLFDSPIFRRQFLDNLIDETLLVDTLTEAGLSVADSQLRQTIQSAPGFQTDGQFNPETYQIFLSTSGQTTEQFEQQVRRTLMLQELPRVLGSSSLSTGNERDQLNELQNQQRDYEYLLLDVNTRQQSIEITDAATHEYYSGNAINFMEEEKVIVDYVTVLTSDIATSIEISDAELMARYDAQKDQLKEAERRLASHILLQVDESDAESVEQRRTEAAQLAERARSGENFAALADEFSDDAGPGGDLDWVDRGVMVTEFEEALFALASGEISDPVRTEFGFHVIQLREIQSEKQQTYEEAKPELERLLRDELAQDRFAELEANLSQLAFEQSSSLEAVAEAAGVTVMTSESFSRSSGLGVGAFAAARTAAFSDEVLQERRNSDTILVEPGHAIYLRVAQYIEPTQRPLEDVEEEIRTTLKRQAAQTEVDALAEQLLQSLREGLTMTELAETHALERQSVDKAGRFDSAAPFAINRGVFALPRPKAANEFAVVDVGNGNKAVVNLLAVTVAESESSDRSALAQRIERARASAEISALLAELRTQAKVSVDSGEFSNDDL